MLYFGSSDNKFVLASARLLKIFGFLGFSEFLRCLGFLVGLYKKFYLQCNPDSNRSNAIFWSLVRLECTCSVCRQLVAQHLEGDSCLSFQSAHTMYTDDPSRFFECFVEMQLVLALV